MSEAGWVILIVCLGLAWIVVISGFGTQRKDWYAEGRPGSSGEGDYINEFGVKEE